MHKDAGDLWVFGYGSLMWRPGFQFIEAERARLTGWHRRFCIVSRHYRGTALRPGLLLGLDRGGTCEGVAFRVAAGDVTNVLKYLRAREQISGVYRETRLSVNLIRVPHEQVRAVVFLAEPAHPSFAHRLSVPAQAQIIATAAGSTGSNLAYLANTIVELKRLGIRERELQRILTTIGVVRANGAAMLKPRIAQLYRGRTPSWKLGPRARLSEVKRFVHRSRIG